MSAPLGGVVFPPILGWDEGVWGESRMTAGAREKGGVEGREAMEGICIICFDRNELRE